MMDRKGSLSGKVVWGSRRGVAKSRLKSAVGYGVAASMITLGGRSRKFELDTDSAWSGKQGVVRTQLYDVVSEGDRLRCGGVRR